MPPARYSLPSIFLHWLTVLLIAAAYATIELREFFPKGSELREALKSWHYAIGLSIFALVWLRLLLRAVVPTPRGDEPRPRWEALASGVVHLGLYALMIATPLLGWLLLSAEGDPVLWFGLELPPLVAPSESLAERVESLHQAVGKAGYGLIGVHAAAALLHHYLFSDAVMARMLPTRTAVWRAR